MSWLRVVDYLLVIQAREVVVFALYSDQVLDVALSRVSSAELSDLPTVIKFVVQQVTPKNAQEVWTVCRIRYTCTNAMADE